MKVTSINQNINNNQSQYLRKNFNSKGKSNRKYTTRQKILVATTTATGVFSSLAILAKLHGHSIKPKNLLNYYKNTDFLFKEVASMGIGTVLGGLAGGYLIDKNPANRKAKQREGIMQLGNIIIPIGTVATVKKVCDKVNLKGNMDTVIRVGASFVGILGGIYIANFAMNKLSNLIFDNKTKERNVKATDMFPHIDDVLVSAQYIPGSKFVHKISRIVPFALMVAGNEVGNARAR